MGDLTQILKSYTKPGEIIQRLLTGDSVLPKDQSLEASRLGSCGKAQVVLGGKPVLHVADSSDDLCLFGSDDEGEDENDDASPFQNLSQAPEVAREVANAMAAAAPDLSDMAIVGGDESGGGGGQVVVIANPGDDAM